MKLYLVSLQILSIVFICSVTYLIIIPAPITLGFPCGSAGKESTRIVEDLSLIPGLERSPEEGKGKILQYSGLENAMDCIVHGVAKSQTRLSDFHFHFQKWFS